LRLKSSTAIYPGLGSAVPAATSKTIIGLLREQLGFRGAIATDALQTPEVNHYYATGEAAVRAVNAGDDLVLAAGSTPSLADTDGASMKAYAALISAARSGRIGPSAVRLACDTVMSLKER
jgi:beta-N-acetylhexosaminidase